jgi:hypothetical protein
MKIGSTPTRNIHVFNIGRYFSVMKGVIECDTVKGYLIRYKKNSKGEIIIKGGVILTEELKGSFLIIKFDV